MRYFFFFLLFTTGHMLNAQDHYPHNPNIDVKQYVFQIEISDQSDIIKGKAAIDILFKESVSNFELDFVNKTAEGKGMEISRLMENGQIALHTHENNRITIHCDGGAEKGEKRTYQIEYEGKPADGLVISKNKHGERTFFGDNWPNRAHNWLPCIDHPSDKSKVDFIITAPDHYQVIANGIEIEETNLKDGKKLSHWRERMPLPTKVMVFGAARFAVQQVGEVDDIPVESWIFTEDREKGFYDYSQAKKVLDFFIGHVAPYPYKKLANVQSKTRYGGMENASNIFYFENSVTGKREHEDLIAHEIAHQWFGNSASELYWNHIWLSEGFATYFTDLYIEYTYGRDRMNERMLKEKDRVLKFAEMKSAPIVDPSVKDYNKLLNPNSYQKGAWVLHMLRKEIGDDFFWEGIRTYYQRYQGGNAVTKDLRRVMEEVSGKDLEAFFQQWIFTAGHPKLTMKWEYDEVNKKVNVSLLQKQEKPFHFPLEIGILYPEGKAVKVRSVEVQQATHEFSFDVDKKPIKLELDPNVWLLYEGVE